jgi:predicted dehydrogenase
MGAKPINYNTKALESVAYATIRFEDDSIGHVHVSWISPVKVRRTLIGGSQKMIVYDHLDPDNQVKVYDKGVNVRSVEQQHQALVQYRLGDMYAPKVEQTEALEAECRHFVDCCMGKTKPLTDGYEGLRVVRLLEAAQLSMNAGGASVVIDKMACSIHTDSVYVGNA